MKKTVRTRALAIFCAVMFCFGITGTALAVDIMPFRASDYLTAYDAWATTGNKGEVRFSFDVEATKKMTVGTTTIAIFENNNGVWSNVQTYTGTTNNGMLKNNVVLHAGTITYSGTSGKQYRATVTVYAGNNTGGDSRAVVTNTVTAP